MRRRDKAGGKAAKAQRSKTLKRRNALKAARRGSSLALGRQTNVALLTRERDDALEQLAATSEVLKVISASPGELEPVFNTLLANATRICEATFGNMFLHEGHGFRTVAVHGTQSYADYARHNPVIDLREHPGIPLERNVKTKQVIHIADLRTDPSYIGKNSRIVALADIAGARTLLAVPMLKEDDTRWRNCPVSPGSAAVHREADRIGPELRRSGRHRHREHAAAQRAARILAAADRDRRCAQGHQPLDF